MSQIFLARALRRTVTGISRQSIVLFIAQIRRGLASQDPPRSKKSHDQGHGHAAEDGQSSEGKVWNEAHVQESLDHAPGGQRSQYQAAEAREQARQGKFRDEDGQDVAPGRAADLVDDAVVDASVLVGRKGSGQDKKSSQQRDGGHDLENTDRARHEHGGVVEHVADGHHRHVRKLRRDQLEEDVVRILSVGRAQPGLGRGLQNAGGENNGELHGQGTPVHLADIADGPGQGPAQDVDAQGVSQIHAKALGQVGGQGNERRPGMVLVPPRATNHGAARRQIRGVGQTPIAAHGPGHVLADRGVFDRSLANAHDASAHHGP